MLTLYLNACIYTGRPKILFPLVSDLIYAKRLLTENPKGHSFIQFLYTWYTIYGDWVVKHMKETLYWTELVKCTGCYHLTFPPKIAISMDPAEQIVNIVGISSTRGSISLSIKSNTIWRWKQSEMTRIWLIFYKMVSSKRSWYKAVFFIYYRECQLEC